MLHIGELASDSFWILMAYIAISNIKPYRNHHFQVNFLASLHAHFQMVGNVIVQCELLLISIFQFLRPQKKPLATILDFGSISEKSLAHPHVARNVMLKFQKDLTSSFCAHKKT